MATHNSPSEISNPKSRIENPMWDIAVAFSYDDILLLPMRSSISSRRQVVTTTQLSRNVRLQVPVVSANMDTVTESTMATEMARQGGIGIIHRFISLEAQPAEVRRVKRAESFVIAQPYTIAPDQTIEQAHRLMEQRDVSGLLVVDVRDSLVGLISSR